MAAAIAYRAVFAIAPLLLIAVFVAGTLLGGPGEARDELLARVTEIAGEEIAETFESVLDDAGESAGLAAAFGFALLFWTGSGLFLEVQRSLNDIFSADVGHRRGWRRIVRLRLIGFGWSVGLGLLLVVVFFLNSVLAFIGSAFPGVPAPWRRVLTAATPLVSLALMLPVFGVVLQTMTRRRIPWRAAWRGGAATGAAIVVVAYGAGQYFSRLGPPSAFGVAGSVVLVLLFTYVLASVFLFGAEVTDVYAGLVETRQVS